MQETLAYSTPRLKRPTLRRSEPLRAFLEPDVRSGTNEPTIALSDAVG
jgi:hypothetical protein